MFGIDISNIQNKINLYNGKELFDFAIIKVSEGKTLKDKSAIKFSSELRDMGKLIGCYHFCRPDLNSPEDEAENFIDAVYSCDLLHNAILVADWETSTEGNTEWLQNFCSLVYNKTGVIPLVYGSSNVLSSIRNYMGNEIHLWVAQWPNTVKYTVGSGPDELRPKTKCPWEIWQYSSTGIFPRYSGRIDLDFSTLSREEWVTMARGNPKETITEDMRWAIDIGLFGGYKDGTYRPNEPLTRQQAATLFRRYNNIIVQYGVTKI